MSILIAPHNDDEALYASYLILLEKPEVYIVYDGYQHQEKFNVKIEERRKESEEAMKILGVNVHFLGGDDRDSSKEQVCRLMKQIPEDEIYYAPAKQGGNVQHDLVSDCAKELFNKVFYYATYTKDNLTPKGKGYVMALEGQAELKEKALACYKSQIRLNKPHFDAVRGQKEWLV
jgi:LmbE family N-acetylglucosaminyl deacetylase